MTDRPNGQLPDGALVRTVKEPGQAAYEARFVDHPAFMDWSTLRDQWKAQWRDVESAVLAEHSTPVLKTLNAEIDRLRQELARRDSQLAASGVPCPEIPEGMVPPGALQAYSDAHRKYPDGQDLQAHTAGLRAVLILDRAQRVPRVSITAKVESSETMARVDQMIERLRRISDAGRLMLEDGRQPATPTEKPLGQIAYEARFEGFTLGQRGVSVTWQDLGPEGQANWYRVAQAVQAAAPPSKFAPLPAFTREMGEAADRYLMSVAFKGDHILPAQFRWFDCWAAMAAAVPKPVPFRFDPRWTGTSLGFEGGCMNLKLPAGSAELVFAEDDLEAIEEEGRTLRICRLAASEVRALRLHLNVYLDPVEPGWPAPIITAAKGV